ncbi:hypothetical protein AB0M25_01880 [Streptomyces griseomycini]|nr:hypothetical protein [Streptomyces griseomycini]
MERNECRTEKLFESYRDDIGDGSVNDALADMSDAVVRGFEELEDGLARQVDEKTKVEDKRKNKGDRGGT